MSISEAPKSRAEVFRRPTTVLIEDEGDRLSPTFIGQQGGQEVGVIADGHVIWRREIYPVFIGLRRAFLIDVPRPRYAQRIQSAEREAQKIASTLR